VKYATINRIFLSLAICLYVAAFVAARAATHHSLSLTLLAMGTLLNMYAIFFLGTDLFPQEGFPANTNKRRYLLLYGFLLVLVAVIVLVRPPISDYHDHSGTLVFAAVVATALLLMIAAFIRKRNEKRIKIIEQETFDEIRKRDTFFQTVKYAFVTNSSMMNSKEFSERRKWAITFATAVLVISPYIGFLIGTAMEHMTPIVKYFQAVLPVPKWVVAVPFALPIVGVIALPALFFYYLMGLLMIENREKTSVRAELNAARTVQMGLMPTADPVIQGFDISGKCIPAAEVGGDYYDYLWMNDEKTQLGIAIADVSGKAMKAAMTAVMTSGMVYREMGTNESPRSILRKINRPMYLKTDKRVFTAMSFAVVDTQTRNLSFSNAGQMKPLLKRNDHIESINVEGAHLPLGMAEEVDYEETTLQLQTADTLLFYTDGIPEAMNTRNELFGFERLETVVKETDGRLSASQLAATIVQKVKEFAGSAKQHDDMTIVVVRVL
jgi:serine phosphatase RsbU (regulator of sigma subunit)